MEIYRNLRARERPEKEKEGKRKSMAKKFSGLTKCLEQG